MGLRGYQSAAVEAVYDHLRERDDNPCVVIPTAGGKSHIIAQLCKDVVGWGGRVIALAHVHELLSQNYAKIVEAEPGLALQTGIHSASLGSRDTEHPIIVAGIQSAFRRVKQFGKVDMVIVDEAHLITVEGDGMYRTFIAGLKEANPAIRVVGFTATDYRMTTGRICMPENILNHVCFEAGVSDLIRQGYLCNLVNKGSAVDIDTSGLHMRGGEFVPEEAERLMNEDGLVRQACGEILKKTTERKSVLVFCAGIEHAKAVAGHLDGMDRAITIFGETNKEERAETIRAFKAGKLKYLVNVNVLTTGFDAPNIDCIVLLRPTMSPGLYYQMVGRGFRLHEGKENCLVLDFGGNIVRHGPIDRITIQDRLKRDRGEAPWKKCPECGEIVPAAVRECPACGFVFPVHERTHDTAASEAPILAGQVTTETCAVEEVSYHLHINRAGSRTMRVDYSFGDIGKESEWVCFEHSGYAWEKAGRWWYRRTTACMPKTVEEAVALANAGALAETKSITIRSVGGEDFPQIISHVLGPKPTTWKDPTCETEAATEIRY